MQRSLKASLLLCALLIATGCKPGAPGGLQSSSPSESAGFPRSIVPLPDLSEVSSLIVMSFKGDVSLNTVNGYVVGFPDNLKIEATNESKFFIKNVPDGEHSILITAQSITGQNVGILLNNVRALKGTSNEIVDLSLSPTVDLKARVSNAMGDKTKSLCIVTVLGTKYQGTCGDDGSVVLRKMPFGRYDIKISVDGYSTGNWREFEVTHTDHVQTFNLNSKTSNSGEILISQGPFDLSDLNRLVTISVPDVRANNWIAMRVATNSSISDAKWEPLRTSFTRQIITRSGANNVAIQLKDQTGSVSDVMTAIVNFTGIVTEYPENRSITFQQPAREMRQFIFRQGAIGTDISETFNVRQLGLVDIVVVVDNSGSMREEQTNLSTRLSPLLSGIGDSDWRLVVVSTDQRNSYLRGPLSKHNANYESVFSNYITNAGLYGSGVERPISGAVAALKWRPLLGGSWLRPNSTLAIVVLTDEDDCHIDNEIGYDSRCLNETNDSLSQLANIRNLGIDARVYGLFWHPSQSQGQCPSALKQATNLADLVQRTGGLWGSICDGNYSTSLSRISQDISSILKPEVSLLGIPNRGTLSVTVNNASWDAYQLEHSKLYFTSPPPANATLVARYKSGASGVVSKAFNLPEEPANGQIWATIDGKDINDVKYDPLTRQAVFPVNPPENSQIVISLRENTPLKTAFNIESGIDRKSLKIYVNGTLINVNNYNYDAVSGMLSFNPPPPEGAEIRAEFTGLRLEVIPSTKITASSRQCESIDFNMCFFTSGCWFRPPYGCVPAGFDPPPQPSSCAPLSSESSCSMNSACVWSKPICTRPSIKLGESINKGDGLSTTGQTDRVDQNCKFSAIFTQDGNLIVNQGSKVIWSANSGDKGATHAEFLADGNFIIRAQDSVLFTTATAGKWATSLSLSKNGNLVILNTTNQVIWQSGSIIQGCY